MPNRFAGRARLWALLLVVASALGALGGWWWSSIRRSDISFLQRIPPADWILCPSGPELFPHRRVAISAVFQRSFHLDQAPAEAVLSIAALRHYAICLNAATPAAPLRTGRNWKQPDQFDVAQYLRAGENQITVTVTNTDGPPALWLWLRAGGLRLNSDATWQASYIGAAWRPARLARDPATAIPGSPVYGGEQPWPSLRARWPLLLLFTALSTGAWRFLNWRARAGASAESKVQTPPSAAGTTQHNDSQPATVNLQPSGSPRPAPITAQAFIREFLPLLGLAVLWLALFANNLGVLSPRYGYDADAHNAYVRYVQEKQSLPLGSQGWEMFQPPLYYVLCAALLEVLLLSVSQDGGVLALRIFGLGIGVAHILLVWACLRRLFPGQHSRQRWGLALAAFLPPLLYLSQYVTNEGLAAALVSASVYLALRLVQQERASWRACAGLGFCLGAALLTKSSALLAVPVIVGALLWQALLTQPPQAAHPGIRVAQVGLFWPFVWRSAAGITPGYGRITAVR